MSTDSESCITILYTTLTLAKEGFFKTYVKLSEIFQNKENIILLKFSIIFIQV